MAELAKKGLFLSNGFGSDVLVTNKKNTFCSRIKRLGLIPRCFRRKGWFNYRQIVAIVLTGIFIIIGGAYALPSWITVNGSQTFFALNGGNTLVYNNNHFTDFWHGGVDYGGIPNRTTQALEDNRGYKLIEGYYFGPNLKGIGQCHNSNANFGGIVYADDTVAVIQAGCTGNPIDQELWRYVIPRNQTGFYELERKNFTGYLDAQNDQEVQFLNISALTLYFSTRAGGISKGTGYDPLFTQFSKPGMPFSWEGGYDPTQNTTLGFIQLGTSNLGRIADRRYPVEGSEQQLDFSGAGEGNTMQMPLGATWFETWSGFVSGNATSLRQKSLSLVGNTIDEPIIPFMSTAIASAGGLTANTGEIVYMTRPYLNYDVPYASDNGAMVEEYPSVNGINADLGANLQFFEDPWNATYRNPSVSDTWMNYTTWNGAYNITNKRTAYADADGLVWTYNITALVAGNMTFSINYSAPNVYTPSFTNTTFTEETMDPIEGDYGVTFIYAEPVTVKKMGYNETVSFATRNMSTGDEASYLIYAIPHKMSTPVSVSTFHTHEKSTLKVPYRILPSGLQWMPTDSVTAYDSSLNASGYTVSAFAEAGSHQIQMYAPVQIQSISTDQGSISGSQAPDGTITATWTLSDPTAGTIFLNSSACLASFTANMTSGTVPLAVQFNDNSFGSPIQWNWSFGDSANSTQQNPVHTYTAPGNYTVTLTVSNNINSNTTVETNYITVYGVRQPVADFTANKTSGNVPLAVQFTDTSSGGPTSWNWSFGDGTFSTAENPIHLYSFNGTFTVLLYVSNSAGSNISSAPAFVVTGQLPVANFTANPVSGSSPLTVQFTDLSTGSPSSWNWSFGDGTYSNNESPAHTYTTPVLLSYTVAENVSRNGLMNRMVKTSYITVLPIPLPVVNFIATPTSGYSPLSVTFTDLSSTNITAWNWSFGDGKYSTGQNPEHTFTAPYHVNYSISLTVQNATGSNSLTRYTYISVSPPPLPITNFVANVTSGRSPLTVAFTDLSIGNVTAWNWSFGDATYSNEQNPVHTYVYRFNQTYRVNLTAYNQYGNNHTLKLNYIQIFF